jgi:hypothetical protein
MPSVRSTAASARYGVLVPSLPAVVKCSRIPTVSWSKTATLLYLSLATGSTRLTLGCDDKTVILVAATTRQGRECFLGLGLGKVNNTPKDLSLIYYIYT